MFDLVQLRADVSAFKAQQGIAEQTDDRVALVLHLMRAHDLDRDAALDQTSAGSGDNGIGGWAFDDSSGTLSVFQGTLTESIAKVLDRMQDLVEAAKWLGTVLDEAPDTTLPTNGVLYTLTLQLEREKRAIKQVHFILVSARSPNEIQGTSQFANAERALTKTRLYKWMRAHKARMRLSATQFGMEPAGIGAASTYPIISNTEDEIARPGSPELRVRLVTLASLVELLRRRGPLVFEKNVRMYLGAKKNKHRLEHPMQLTFDSICQGLMPASMFSIYHGGVTVSAASADASIQRGELTVDSPSIVNGCQTVSIADRYLSQLEKGSKLDHIERFRAISVLAKIVVGATDDQLRDITNCNNRQNPIEAWQLFSNDPIHVEIETALRESGIVYERQEGWFASLSRRQVQLTYPNTNGTYLKVIELARLIALCRRQLPLAAKPSDAFASKEVHDALFDASVPCEPRDIVWAFNCWKVARRSLDSYLDDTQVHRESPESRRVFAKPLVRAGIHHLCMLYLGQPKWTSSCGYATKLNKNASHTLTAEVESFLRLVVGRIKAWYLKESNGLVGEVTARRLDSCVVELADELRLRPNGAMPLTNRPVNWADISES